MSDNWSPLAKVYDPIRVANIDGTDTQTHDRAVIRAIKSKYKINKTLKSDPKCTVFVTRLDFNTDERTLEKHFSKYGTIISLRLVRDVVTDLSKGYAFIEFKHRRTARQVYETANNKLIDGRKILVDYEFGRTLDGWKPRRLGGGFGGKKESGQLRFGCRDRPWRRPFRLGKHKENNSSHKDSGHSSKSYDSQRKSSEDRRHKSESKERKVSRSDSHHSHRHRNHRK